MNLAIKYYLSDLDTDETIIEFEQFDKEIIKNAIISHLLLHPQNSIAFYKKVRDKKYYGDTCVDIYENNPKTSVPSRLITKGEKTCYLKLN